MPPLLFHVVYQQQVLIAEIEFATTDDGVRPRGFAAAVRMLEATGFVVALG